MRIMLDWRRRPRAGKDTLAVEYSRLGRAMGDIENSPGAPASTDAMPKRKAWVTPVVILATAQQTASHNSNFLDGSSSHGFPYGAYS
jgi:hypothetical protein